MAVVVDVKKCTGCGVCVEACPVEAIALEDDVAVIDGKVCRECERCVNACPNQAIFLS